MSRTIGYTLLSHATAAGAGGVYRDAENFTNASLQLVYTGKRVSVLLKGRMLGSDTDATLATISSLTTKSGRIIKLDDWPIGIHCMWAELTDVDSGEVSLYFCGRV